VLSCCHVAALVGEIVPLGDISTNRWRHLPNLDLDPILAHSLDAFYDRGYHGTSVRDIARRVHVTVPALYYHYENKEAILNALLDASIERVTELSLEAISDAGDDPTLRFMNLVECLVLFMARSGKLAFVDTEWRSLGSENRRAYTEKRRVIEQLLTDTITAGVEAQVFDVIFPSETARALLGMVQAVANWFRPEGPIPAQAVADRYLDIAVHAVGANATVIQRARQRGITMKSSNEDSEA